MIPHSNVASNFCKVKILSVFLYLFWCFQCIPWEQGHKLWPNGTQLQQTPPGEGGGGAGRGGGGGKRRVIKWMYVCNNECVQSLRLGSNDWVSGILWFIGSLLEDALEWNFLVSFSLGLYFL